MEYTDEQISAMLQREADKRVTEALQTAKLKFEADKEIALQAERERVERETLEKATLSAEELARKQFEEQVKAVTTRETEISKKQNLLTAKELLADAGIPKSKYEKMLGVMISDNSDATVANVNQFIDMFNETKTELETAIRTEFSKVPPPNTGSGGSDITKEKFATMGYAQKLELKQTNPELYKTFIN